MQSTRNSCQALMQVKLSRHSFEKYSNIKRYENPSSGSRVFTCRQTDRHDKVTLCNL